VAERGPAELSVPPRLKLEPIAIIGMSCRLAGDATDISKLWELLQRETDCTVQVPDTRWKHSRFFDPDPARPGKYYPQRGGFLQADPFAFDPLFFGISPRDAESMDPQQRVLMEQVYRAFEDAGLKLEDLRGSRTGMYVGAFTADNLVQVFSDANRHLQDTATATSSTMTMLSNRMSYIFDLRGPSMTVDTACSSSMVAAHLACQSLRVGETSMAVVGGVNIISRPHDTIALSKGKFVSDHGRCAAFDESASGYSRGEGAAVVVLKRLSDALRDEDKIWGVIRHTGVNQDGKTNGISEPSYEAQWQLMQQVYAEIGVSPASVGYIEAHGTGTQAGDVTETSALRHVFDAARKLMDQPAACYVGSIKSNIGHAEAAAGVAGLIKAALVVHHGYIPQTLHVKKLNPKIDLGKWLRIASPGQPYPSEYAIRRASVNSFGYGGTNGHAVIEQPPALLASIKINRSKASLVPSSQDRLPYLLPVSARSPSALRAIAKDLADVIRAKATALPTEGCLDDVLYTLSFRRSHFELRGAVIAKTAEEARTRLLQLSENTPAEGVVLPKPEAATGKRLPLVFVFTGMGPQWHAMGQTLYQESSVFRSALDMLDQAFFRITGQFHLPNMFKNKESSQMHRTSVAQLSNFFLQAGLLEMWRSFGIVPDAVVGHSVGEVASAFASGALSMEDSVLVSHHRGRLQQQLARRGSMMAAGVSEQAAREMLKLHGDNDQVAIAAINAPDSVTLSGELKPLEAIHAQLEAQGTFARFLTVETAYHSAAMDPIRADMLKSLECLRPIVAKIPLYSTVDGKCCDGSKLDAAYWWANVRQEVRFCDTITSIWKDLGPCHFLEVGPHPVLKLSIQRTLADLQPNSKASVADILTTLNRNTDEPLTFMSTLGALYGMGYSPRWQQQLKGDEMMITLPAYPFERVSYRRLSPLSRQELYGQDNASHVYFDTLVESAPGYQQFSVEVGPRYFPWIIDHKVGDSVVFPGAGFVEAALALARQHQEAEAVGLAVAKDLPCYALTGVQFHGMLEYAPGELRRMHTIFDNRQGTRQFQIYSKAAGDVGGSLYHASGVVSPLTWPPSAQSSSQFAIGEIKDAEIYRTLAVTQFYEVLTSAGLKYGPCFRTVAGLWKRIGVNVDEVVVKLELHSDSSAPSSAAPLGEQSTWNPYILHPTILDGAFQGLVTLMDQSAADSSTKCFVPVEIRQIYVRGVVPNQVLARIKLIRSSVKTVEGDIELYTEHGSMVSMLRGVVCKAVDIGGVGDKRWALRHLMYQLHYEPGPLLTSAVAAPSTQFELLLVGGPLAQHLQGEWVSRETGPSSVLALTSASAVQNYITAASQSVIVNRERRFVFLGFVENHSELDELTNPRIIQTLWERIMSFKVLVSTLSKFARAAPVRITIPSIGAHMATSAGASLYTAGSSSLHLLSAVFEHEESNYVFQSLDFRNEAELVKWLPDLMTDAYSGLVEAVVQNDQLYYPRNRRWNSDVQAADAIPITLSGDNYITLHGYNAGAVDHLKYSVAPAHTHALEPHQVFIRVSRTSLNFKDLLKIYGTIADMVIDNTYFEHTLGMEAVGTVLQVGSAVTDLKVGDEVVALQGDSFQSHVIANSVYTFKRPAQVSRDMAASLMVYLTTYIGLFKLARVLKGERVLIHNAAGGVGFAAISVAKWLGAEVFATAGSDDKRELLRRLGVMHVYDSRSLDFVHAVSGDTNGVGIDVVLNATSGDSLIQSVGLLAPGGRFVEIGKKDISQGGALPLHFFNNNLTFSSLDVDRLLLQRVAEVRAACLDILRLLANGSFNGADMPCKVFEAGQVKDAFNLMKTGQHVGKILVSFDDGSVVNATKATGSTRFSSAGSYLVTGGTKNFGLEVAKWIAAHGAGELILASRSGADTPESKQAVQLLKEQGVRVTVYECDVADEQPVRDLLKLLTGRTSCDANLISPRVRHLPLKGVFHAAVVLEDGFLRDLSPDSFATVMNAKVMGAVLLHRLTEQLNIKLEMFVCFSSVSAVIANPGQSSYVVANSFLDALMRRRQSMGLCGLSINFGAIGGTGILARKHDVREMFEQLGIRPMPVPLACDGMGVAIASGMPQIGVFDVNMSLLFEYGPWIRRSGRFNLLKDEAVAIAMESKSNATAAWRDVIAALPAADRLSRVQKDVAFAVASVLRVAPEALQLGRSPQDLGVDSLTAVEISTKIIGRCGVRLSTIEIMRARSLVLIAERMLNLVNL